MGSDPWSIHFFQRHPEDNPEEAVPGLEAIASWPDPVQAKFHDFLLAVAAGPPPNYDGGGRWKAMHGSMHGIYEVALQGPGRLHYRLFCLLERPEADTGLDGPAVIVIDGLVKANATLFKPKDYASVRALVDEYRRRKPRCVLT